MKNTTKEVAAFCAKHPDRVTKCPPGVAQGVEPNVGYPSFTSLLPDRFNGRVMARMAVSYQDGF